MGWTTAAALNGLIATCYVLIAGLITQGLVRSGQAARNPLAVATAAIFTTCAMHHGHHAVHLLTAVGDGQAQAQLDAVRALYGEWHVVLIDLVGAAVAVVYLGLRRNYRTLLNAPGLFDDAVRRETERQLRELAYTDPLTGVPNRAAFQQHADGLSSQDVAVAVLFLDLDGFKLVNDRLGHDAGDRVLREVAQRLATELADGLRVFRLGGDELVVVGTGLDRDDAERLVEQVVAVVARPVTVRGGAVEISVSVGLACGRSGGGVDALLREADQEMYAAKQARVVSLPSPRAAELPVDDRA